MYLCVSLWLLALPKLYIWPQLPHLVPGCYIFSGNQGIRKNFFSHLSVYILGLSSEQNEKIYWRLSTDIRFEEEILLELHHYKKYFYLQITLLLKSLYTGCGCSRKVCLGGLWPGFPFKASTHTKNSCLSLFYNLRLQVFHNKPKRLR